MLFRPVAICIKGQRIFRKRRVIIDHLIRFIKPIQFKPKCMSHRIVIWKLFKANRRIDTSAYHLNLKRCFVHRRILRYRNFMAIAGLSGFFRGSFSIIIYFKLILFCFCQCSDFTLRQMVWRPGNHISNRLFHAINHPVPPDFKRQIPQISINTFQFHNRFI